MHKISALFVIALNLILSSVLMGQSYSPISVSGFNCDVVADAPTVPLNTSIAMDLQNNVMYTQTMAAFLGLSGGIVDNGTITNGTSTYQLVPYNGNCALHVTIGSTQALSINVPLPYAKLSVLALSTEFYSNVTISAAFTDGSTYNFGSFQVQDWFGGTGAVYCCYGRIFRVAGPPYGLSGFPTDPRMYKVDLNLPCAYMSKSLASVSFNTTSGGGANSSLFVFAVSGILYSQTIIPAITNVTCNGGNNGSIALNVTGSNSPFTYNWNTVPVQTNATATGLPAGTYICTITDANGCTVKDTSIVTQPPLFTVIPTAIPDTICSGDSTQLSVTGLSSLTWNPGGQTTSTVTVFPPGLTIYSVSGSDVNGCTVTGSVTVVVNAGASVTIAPNPVSICSGDNVQLQALGATSYSWSPALGLSNSTVSNPIANPTITTVYTVTGTNPGGCNSVATDTVNVYASAAINPTATPTSICAGDTTVLTASGLISYNWNPGGQTTNTVTVNPVVSATYTITGIDNNGCSATDSVAVVVYQNPAITISPGSASFCSGDSVLIQLSGANSYSWLPASGITNTASANTWSHPTASTTYTVTGTDGSGCTGTSSVNVTVNTLPVVIAVANPPIICLGTGTQLTSTGLVSLTWNPGGQTASTININPTATTTYTVTGTDSNGCTGSATALVTVDTVPIVSAASPSTLICNGAIVPLTVSGNSLNYSWNPGGLTGDTISVTPAITTSYTVTGTSGGNCSATDTITVNVIPFPVSAFTPSAINGCDPLTVSFANQSTGATAWHWLYSDGDSSFSQNPLHIFTTGIHDVTLIVSNLLGCADTLFQPGLINVLPYPQAEFVPSVINGCEPLSVSFTDQSLNNPATWQWQFSNGNSSLVQNPIETFTSGTYDVSLIVTNSIGCKDTLTQTALINVFSKPIPAFTVSPLFNTPVELNEATFTFTDHSIDAVSYLWNFGDTDTSQLINPVHTYIATGNYFVSLIVTSAEGCIDTITQGEIEIFQNNFLVIPSGFTPDDDGLNDTFIIPPNPNIKAATLSVYNRWGQMIFTSDDKDKGWNGYFNGVQQQEGVYVYRAIVTYLNGQHIEKTGHITLMK